MSLNMSEANSVAFQSIHNQSEADVVNLKYLVFVYILLLVEKSLSKIICLLACLLICPHSTDWSKQQYENETKYFLKKLSEANWM